MKHDEFSKLPFKEQCILLRDYALPVAEREDHIHKYYLFQLHSFYIEIKVSMADNVLEELVSFADTKYIDKYLEPIDIVQLIT
jgi:hypothetical protein